MAYNRDNVKKVIDIYTEKRSKALDISEARRAEIHKKIPEIEEIDGVLSLTGVKIFEASREGPDGLDERIQKLRGENFQLNKIRREILVSMGYPEDYTDIKYECDLCSDSGYVGINMCSCMKNEMINLGYESSGIGRLMEKQKFETFSLDYYSGQEKEMMRNTLTYIKKYAATFGDDKESHNILMIGPTGLGKTHLSTSVAKTVIEKGYDVIYETSQNIFSDFEYEKFKSGYGESEDKTSKYFECDLLIMDDLGTEAANTFTVSCLYNIINTRLNHAKSTIINTNLTRDDLYKRYADRITSRLFGEFSIMLFRGNDIRAQKLK